MQLGYNKVAHGFDWWLEHLAHSITYRRLALVKFSSLSEASKSSFVDAREFDRVPGECEAVTDVPAIWFAKELL